MGDPFENHSPGLEAPASGGAAVVPDDNADLGIPARFLWVGGAGDVDLVTVGGESLLVRGCAAGTVVPIRTRRVRATATTATDILACW